MYVQPFTRWRRDEHAVSYDTSLGEKQVNIYITVRFMAIRVLITLRLLCVNYIFCLSIINSC